MINYIDFLSPPITLYHLERRTHTSKTGGILVIIMASIILSYISFLLYNLISHKNMISIFHKKFQFEAGYYSFNSSSIFHFIQIYSSENGGFFDKYNSKYIRIYTTYASSNYSDSNLDLYDHWVFDSCEQNIDNKDLDPILFSNVVNFTNSACIRYYYNSKEKKYYSLGDKNFYWPYLEHGISQRNNVYLTTIVQKCTNNSIINNLYGDCPSQKEIDDYLNRYIEIYFYFTDIQVDPTNYKYPLQKYIHTISSRIGANQVFEENYIYYSPLKIRTKEGSFFSIVKDIDSFYFDFNRKDNNVNNEKFYILAKYYHYMQNSVQIYERIYNNIFDLFSEIGGVIQFIFYIFFWMNYIYNKYIIAYDTYSMFFSVQNEENKDIKRKYLNFKDNKFHYKRFKKYLSVNLDNKKNFKNNIINKSKNNNTLNHRSKNNKKISLVENKKSLNTDVISKNNFLSVFKKINKNFDSLTNINKLNIDFNSSNVNLKENNNYLLKNKSHESHEIKIRGRKVMSNKEYINRICLSQKSLGKIEHNNLKFREILVKENIKSSTHFSFLDFLKSFCFKKNKGSYNFLITFRRHLLSEEHLFKNHIKIVLIEKHVNLDMNEKTNIMESYNAL